MFLSTVHIAVYKVVLQCMKNFCTIRVLSTFGALIWQLALTPTLMDLWSMGFWNDSRCVWVFDSNPMARKSNNNPTWFWSYFVTRIWTLVAFISTEIENHIWWMLAAVREIFKREKLKEEKQKKERRQEFFMWFLRMLWSLRNILKKNFFFLLGLFLHPRREILCYHLW